MSGHHAYDELVEQCCGVIVGRVPKRIVEAILAEVARTLENATPEMTKAAFDQMVPAHDAYAAWRSMLKHSPLFPPDKEPPR